MASFQFLCTLKVTDSITKKISNDAISAGSYYSHEVLSAPTLSLSGSGYVSASFGSIVLRNDPLDPDAVFCFRDGTYPPELKTYEITIMWGEQDSLIFKGSASIRSISDTSIELDLTPPVFETDLLSLTLGSGSRVRVDSTSNASGVVRVQANNHPFATGDVLIFQELNTTTGLNYDGTESKKYSITYVDSSHFDLDGTNSSLFTLGTNSAGYVGTPVVSPLAFGNVTHRIPVQKSNLVLENPGLDHSATSAANTIRVFNNGIEIGNNIPGDPNQFTTAPTSTKITLNSPPLGEVSISGVSTLGSTVSGVFSNLCSRLGLTLDSSRAGGASSSELQFYVDSQVKVIDLADHIATSTGFQFWISGTTLYLVDKDYQGTETEISRDEISGPQLSIEFPVKRVESTWEARTPFSSPNPRLGSTKHYQFKNSSKFTVGNINQVDQFTEKDSVSIKYLIKIMSYLEKVIVNITKNEIDFSIKIGDNLRVDDLEKLITFSFIVRGISYDFSKEKTSLTGDGTCQPIVIG